MNRMSLLIAALACAWLLGAQPARAQQKEYEAQSGAKEQNEQAELVKALKDAKVPLQQGIGASGQEGAPISAKYEVEDGKLQLSVYTLKGDTFEEVIVDHDSGKIAKAEPLSKPEDLEAAKQQRDAMRKAKTSLQAAAEKASKQSGGARVINIVPTMKAGHPVADVTLADGDDVKQVSERLD